MKKLIAIVLVCGLGYTASAQHGRVGSHRGSHSRVSIGIGVGSSYNYGYNRMPGRFNSYPYRSYNYNRPTGLDLQIQDINNEYKDRIWSVKHDKTLSRQQRKDNLRVLRYEREKAIIEARRNYYKRY